MKHIGKDDKILMQSIRESMFVFETLILSAIVTSDLTA